MNFSRGNICRVRDRSGPQGPDVIPPPGLVARCQGCDHVVLRMVRGRDAV
ncbi:DUF6510 family protein [Streptomyces sp. NBC_01619]